jgi:hypothetical protein
MSKNTQRNQFAINWVFADFNFELFQSPIKIGFKITCFVAF